MQVKFIGSKKPVELPVMEARNWVRQGFAIRTAKPSRGDTAEIVAIPVIECGDSWGEKLLSVGLIEKIQTIDEGEQEHGE